MGTKTSVHGQMTFVDGVRVLPSHRPTKLSGRMNKLVLEGLKAIDAWTRPSDLAKDLNLKIGQVGPRLAELHDLGLIIKMNGCYCYRGESQIVEEEIKTVVQEEKHFTEIRLQKTSRYSDALTPWEPTTDVDQDLLQRYKAGERLDYGSFRQLIAAYHKSYEWSVRRSLVLIRANGRCEGCKQRAARDTHHLHYQNLFDEPLHDLYAVCRACHEFFGDKGNMTDRRNNDTPATPMQGNGFAY